MIKETIEQIDKRRDFYNKIINESEHGKYKNICSGSKDCKNKTVYKFRYLKTYNYYCIECINIKNTELPM